MIARVILVLAVLAHAADASNCREVSDVVGYERCSWFGHGWVPSSLQGDVGVALLGMQIGPIDHDVIVKDGGPATAVHVASSGDRRIVAVGPRLRVQFQIDHPLYIGSDFTLGFIDRAPDLVTTTPAGAMTGTAGGYLMTGLAFAGVQTVFGRWFVGSELGAGFHAAVLTTPALDHAVNRPGDLEFAAEVRGRGGVYVTHWLSVDVAAGVDVIDRSAYSIGVSFGLHLAAWDGLR